MFEWNVEDMVLRRPESKTSVEVPRWLRVGAGDVLYVCEKELSQEDKIAFVDEHTDGCMSYVLAKTKQFHVDAENMPKDQYGGVKTVSLKAWLKRNDDRKIFNIDYSYGIFHIAGVMGNIQNQGIFEASCFLDNCSGEIFGSFVDRVFHAQLVLCEEAEEKYFREHDEYCILKEKFLNKNYHTTFGVHVATWSDGSISVVNDEDHEKYRDVTVEELKELLAKYEQLDALVEKLTKETNIVY